MEDNYISKATITKISATSRAAVKVGDNFYTVEFSEERSIPDVEDVDIEKERGVLFDAINNVVDAQVADIIRMMKKK